MQDEPTITIEPLITVDQPFPVAMQTFAGPEDHYVTGERGTPYRRPIKKIGRNDSCHCDSGRKYKHCHLKVLEYWR